MDESFDIPESTRIRLAELSNPMLDAAISSLSNAFEAFQKEGERHRQAALIQMDQAVEYLLKAALFQTNSSEFMKNDWENMTYEKALQRLENDGIAVPEKDLLRKAHTSRNEAQHRGVVSNVSWTRFHLKNVYEFIRRFCIENFELRIDDVIPVSLRLGFYKGSRESAEGKTENKVGRVEFYKEHPISREIEQKSMDHAIAHQEYKKRAYLKDSVTGEVLNTTVMYYGDERIVGSGNVIAKLREVIPSKAKELGGKNLELHQFIKEFRICGSSYGDVVRKAMKELEAKGLIQRRNIGNESRPHYVYDLERQVETERKSTGVLRQSEQYSAVEEREGTCPQCGSPLVWHTAGKTGERYRGCTNYPACKYNERSY